MRRIHCSFLAVMVGSDGRAVCKRLGGADAVFHAVCTGVGSFLRVYRIHRKTATLRDNFELRNGI